MKKESPETHRRRLAEEQERLAEYAKEEIVVETSTVDVRAQLRSMFRVSAVGSEERPAEPNRLLNFNQTVDLMEHCMFEMEEEEVEAEEEQRRVQESLGEVDPGFTSPRTSRKHVFRDLTILQDGEERKEKLVERAIDSKDEDSSTSSNYATEEVKTSPETAAPAAGTVAPTKAETPTPKAETPPEKSKAETAHEKHEKLERARMAMMHRTASGGTLLPNKGGDGDVEVLDVKKGRAMALAPRTRRQTQATTTEDHQAGQAPSPTARVIAVGSAAMGLAAMKAAMEEKAKLYRPPGARAKTLPAHHAQSTNDASAPETARTETTLTNDSEKATSTVASPETATITDTADNPESSPPPAQAKAARTSVFSTETTAAEVITAISTAVGTTDKPSPDSDAPNATVATEA